jgi:hypothetical protein
VIANEPLATLPCTRCGDPVQVLGDTRCTPERHSFVCVYCLDPRQREHDEFLAAEAQLDV